MIGNGFHVSKFAVCFILFSGFAACEVLGQSSDGKRAEAQPLVIQTVPNAELKKFLTNERPVRRAVFEEFLRAHDAKQGDVASGPLSVQIHKATYEARLSAEGILEGTARIELVSHDSQPRHLPTADFQLSVRSLKWKDRDDPVIWGLSPDQRLLLVVPRSGELEFSWSARTLNSGTERLDFDLGLLRANNTDFTLTASRKWKVMVDGKSPTDSSADDVDLVRHAMKLGASRRLQLRLENTTLTSVGKPSYWVRQTTRLDVGRQGIDLVADLEIEPTGAPLSTLPLRIDGQLQLISAKMGDQPLHWSSRQEGKEQSVELHFEPPLAESGRKVRLEARAKFTDEKMISLPRVRPLDAVLRDVEIELHTAPPLEMVGVELEGARFSDSGPVTSTRGGETRRFRLTSPDADIQCAFRSPEFRGRLRYGAQLTVNEATFELAARARLDIESGESFDLTSLIPTGWVIDGVESTPAGDVENWSVTTRESMQQLSLRLSRALNTKSPLNLQITAHLPRVGNESLPTKSLFLANFDDLSFNAGYLRLNSAPAIRADAVGDAAIRLNPVTLSPGDLELLPEGSSGVIYSLTPHREFAIAHSNSEAEFRAQVVSRILLESDRIISRHRLTISPQRRQLDRLLVRIHPGTGSALSFDLEGASTQRLNAGLVSSDPQNDLWELRFSEPFTSDCTIIATENAPVASKTKLRTLACEGAASQESNLVVYCTNEKEWEINVNGAQTLGAKADAPLPLIELASIRFSLTDHPEIEVTRKQAQVDARPLWAWMESRVTLAAEEQKEVHEATFRLESHLPSEATFQLPGEGKLLEVRLNGEVIHSYRLAAQSLRIPIAMTLGEQSLQIRVAANRATSSLGMTPVSWKGAVAQFPVLSKSWTIWTPPGMAVEPVSLQPNFGGCFSLIERPLARNSDDWMDVWFKSNKSLAKNSSPLDETQLRIAGWRSTQVFSKTEIEPQVLQFDDSSWRLVGWCAVVFSLLTIYSLMGNKGWRRWLAFLVVLACAIASTFVSGPGKLLLSGVFLGGVLGALLLGLRSPREVARPSARMVLSPSRLVTALLIWLSLSQTFLGQTPLEPTKKAGAAPVRNVIDPVDVDGKPVGDFVYVSPELFEELALTSPVRASEPCLLQAVRYRVSHASNPETGSILLAAEYSYFASADVQPVLLPVNISETPLNSDEYYVDGERRRLPASREGRMPQVELLGRGSHTVRVDLRVPLRGEKDASLATWKALPLGTQEIEIETDSTLAWTLDDVVVNPDPVSRVATLRLSPSREVRFGLRRIVSAAAIIETLLRHDAWITLGPGSIAVENVIRVSPDSAATSLVFELDEGMSLASVVGPNRRTLTAVSLGDRRYRVPLEPTVADEASLRIQCSAKSGLALSRIQSTGISFPNAKVIGTRIGASASAEFALEAESRAGTQDIPVVEFAKSWPAGKSPPQLAFSVEANRTWHIDVKPNTPQSSAKQHTEYVIHPSTMQIQWEADTSSGGDPVSFYSLSIPAALRVESVSVSEGAANRLVRFARTSPERLSLFMRTAAIEPRHIQLQGTMPFNASVLVALPALSLENATLTSQSIRVFRGYDALVEVTNTKGLRSVDSSPLTSVLASTLAPQSSRLLGAFDVPSSPQPWEAQLTVSFNRPEVSHQSIAHFELKDSKWRLRQNFMVSIQAGLVDEVEVELPSGLREPVTIEPAEPFRIVQAEGGPTRLVISPAQPWKDTRELRVSGEFVADAGSAELVLSPARLLRSTLQLGQIAATKQAIKGDFAWKGDGAEEIPSPEGTENADAYLWFKQRDDQSSIQLQRKPAAVKQTSPRLEGEMLLSDNRYLATLTWIWSAPSTQDVMLNAPPGVQVVRVRVIGSSARVTQVDERNWRLAPALGAAPPVLEVVCAGEYSPGIAVSLPTIDGASNRQSMVTVDFPRDLELSKLAGETLETELSAALARLRMLDQVKRDVRPLLPTLGLEESIRWRRNWLSQWDLARAMVTRESGFESAGGATSIWLREADAERALMASEVELSSTEPDRGHSTPGVEMLAAIAQGRSRVKGATAHFVSEEKPLSITFERREVYAAAFASLRSSLEESPWIIFVGGGGLLLLMFFASSPRRRAVAIAIAPAVAWITLGTAWWFWFSPAWFGPLVAGAAVLFLAGSFARRSVSAWR